MQRHSHDVNKHSVRNALTVWARQLSSNGVAAHVQKADDTVAADCVTCAKEQLQQVAALVQLVRVP